MAVVVGIPGVMDPVTDRVGFAVNIAGLDGLPLREQLTEALEIAPSIENDVKLAAVGERWHGRAVRHENFVFIAVGTGIGMGIVTEGDLLRGSTGAAGEIAYLPIGADPFDERVRRRGALEVAAAGSGVRELTARLCATHPSSALTAEASPEEVFAAARAGDLLGTAVEGEASLLAQAILAVAATLNPELVILGGGLEPLRRCLGKLLRYPLTVDVSSLGDRAAIHGGLAFGLGIARDAVSGRT